MVVALQAKRRTTNRRSETLSERQKRFVEEFLTDFNATKAYRRAGYGAKNDAVAASSASELLRIPKVQAAVEEGRSVLRRRAEITKADLICQALEIYENAMQVRPILTAKGTPTGRSTCNLSAALDALELLAKLTGNLSDKTTMRMDMQAQIKQRQGAVPLHSFANEQGRQRAQEGYAAF
jgi:phage terminase small subunit